jgi:dTMP kinase
MERKKAPFIAFEGIDKCGKGTQARLAAYELARKWDNSVLFAEPNDRENPTGRYIREVLQHKRPAPPIPDFQRLFVFDRAQDTVCRVLPALERGIPVVAERFALSTIAYGMLQGKAADYVQMHRDVLGPWLRWPDVTIILDIPAEVAIQRLAKEKKESELFQKLEPLTKIRAAYRALANRMSEWAPEMRIKLLNADNETKIVTRDVQAVLQPYLS